MWTCAHCGESSEDQFDACWKCSTPRPENPAPGAVASPAPTPVATPAPPPRKNWRMEYKYFRGTFASWDQLFNQAADFATEIGPEWVVGISHSCDDDDGVVTVWYWTDNSEEKGEV